MIALPLLWGQAIALLATGQFSITWLALTLLFGAANQVHILYLNDYADEAVDKLNKNYWLSGGSRVIPEAQLSGEQLYKASFIALAVMLIIGLVAAYFGRVWMLPLTVAAGLLGWCYSLKPLRSSYRGFGEAHQAVCCGLLLPITGFYLQTGSLTDFAWLSTMPLMMIFFAGNIVTALLDTDADRQGRKRTFPVRHGEKSARKSALAILLSAYLVGLVIAASTHISISLSCLVFLPALGLLAYSMYTGLLESADSSNRESCKRFVALTTTSQIWVIALWVSAIFWQAI